jgi:hypothetical protein
MKTCALVLVNAENSSLKAQVIIQVVVVRAVKALDLLKMPVIDLPTQSA